MKNYSNYFKKEKWTNPVRSSSHWKSRPSVTLAELERLRPCWRGIISNRGAILLLLGIFLVFSRVAYSGSIKDVSQSVKRVQSVERPFQFAVVGDNRDGERVYRQLIQAMAGRKPDFLINLGDMIPHPREKEWQTFFEISKPINLPFFPVVGNHDVGMTAMGAEIYRKQFSLPDGRAYYSFRAGRVLFIVLDSEEAKGKIIKEQRAWLEDTLLSSKEASKFIFIHRPLFLPKNSLLTGRVLDKYPLERDNLHQLFLKTKVKAVFAGDDHRYDRREKDGILYLISGGGGAPLTAFEASGGYYHYIWISVQKERVEGETVDLDGKVQDRFVIE